MTPEDFKAKRQAIWGTQKRCAEALRVTIQAVRFWEQGKRRVSAPMVRLIECIEKVADEVSKEEDL